MSLHLAVTAQGGPDPLSPRRIRRHRSRRGFWPVERQGTWSPAHMAVLQSPVLGTGRLTAGLHPIADASPAERVKRLGGVLDRLLALTGGERAHRAAGQARRARDLAAVRVDVLDTLSRTDRDEMLLIAMDRAAPALRSCPTCGGLAGADHACARCPVVGTGEHRLTLVDAPQVIPEPEQNLLWG